MQIESLRKEINDLSIKVVELSAELKSFKETTIPVFKLLGGIGDPDSLGTKVTINELELRNIKEELKNYSHQRIMLWTAIVSGVLGLFSSIFTALVTVFSKR